MYAFLVISYTVVEKYGRVEYHEAIGMIVVCVCPFGRKGTI